jgi:hypothetical protein
LFPKKSVLRGQRCCCRRTHIDVAGAPQVVHFPDPVNFDTVCLSELSQGHRNGGVRILGQVDPCDSAPKQRFAKLLHSDDFLMVPKLGELVVTRRTPYKHGIHTNQYYTPFYKKVNNLLLFLFINCVDSVIYRKRDPYRAERCEKNSTLFRKLV